MDVGRPHTSTWGSTGSTSRDSWWPIGPTANGLLGSCWTKIHRTTEPVLGEIYVISVDPALHGQGWGRALTVAGLQWMASQGVTVGMLYVTGSNTGAVKLYQSLGFTVDHVDRSYVLMPS